MNFSEELKKYNEKNLEEKGLKYVSHLGDVEKTIKQEIRKGNLILQSKIEALQDEISNLNLENDQLKKELFRKNRDYDKQLELTINILDAYSVQKNLTGLSEEEKSKLELVEKKVNILLKRENIDTVAEIEREFDPRFHEGINELQVKKEKYIISEIIKQGYVKDGKLLREAKVIIK